MERGSSPGRWAHRVIVTPPQEHVLGDKFEHHSGRVRSSSASSPVATTKTRFEPDSRACFTRPRSQSSSGADKVYHRLSRTPPLTPSVTYSRSPSSTPRVDGIQSSLDINDNVVTNFDEAIYQKHSRDAHNTHHPRSLRTNQTAVISADANELINRRQGNGPKRVSAQNSERNVARLSSASLLSAESLHRPSRSRGQARRKSFDSHSFLSDDTNSVSSGYASLSTFAEDDEKTTNSEHNGSKSHLRRRRSSFSVTETSSRAEYMKAFNDAIRLRNARRVLRDQRPNTAKSNLPNISISQSPLGARRWRKLRHAVKSAPVGSRRANMDNGTSDSWEEFIALGMPRDDLIDSEKSSPNAALNSPRNIANITSSREHERILNELKFSGNSNYSKDAAVKKSIMVIASGIRSMNMNNVDKSSRSSPRSKETAKAPNVGVVLEEEEGENPDECFDEDVYENGNAVSGIRCRGWKIVKARLSEIAEKAPKNGIDSTPITFRNIAQLVKAKQFRMMLKRRASFMENGRFQFDEAKQDLYARYKIDPVLVSKLTHTPRESHQAQADSAKKP